MSARRDMFLRTILATTAVALAYGCERQPPAPIAATAPTSAPATQPVAAQTQPASAVMNINGRAAIFPAARMRIERGDDHLVATVFSDDPREALRDNYAGNSFYLKMELDIDDVASIEQAIWRYQAPSSAQRDDSPYGIFLGGHSTQLQPYDVQARFRRESNGVITVFLAGQFQVVEATPGPAKMLPVAAELPARVDKVPAAGK